jgi:hypothetical protein
VTQKIRKTLGIREVAALLSKHLRERGLEAVLVGGACVSIYSSSEYESFDLDFVSYEDSKKIQSALEELGFHKTVGRHYDHPDSRYYAEFLSPPVSIGREHVSQFKHLKTPLGVIKMLTPLDCVKDRMAAYIHWGDRQSLKQAAMVARAHKVSPKKVLAWATKEGNSVAVAELEKEIHLQRKRTVQ